MQIPSGYVPAHPDAKSAVPTPKLVGSTATSPAPKASGGPATQTGKASPKTRQMAPRPGKRPVRTASVKVAMTKREVAEARILAKACRMSVAELIRNQLKGLRMEALRRIELFNSAQASR